MRDRHGGDVDELTAQRSTAGRDEAEAVRLLTEPPELTRWPSLTSCGTPAADAYNTVDRRRNLAAALETTVDNEAAQARVVADTFQARPPADALNPTLGLSVGRGRRAPLDGRGTTPHRTETRGR